MSASSVSCIATAASHCAEGVDRRATGVLRFDLRTGRVRKIEPLNGEGRRGSGGLQEGGGREAYAAFGSSRAGLAPRSPSEERPTTERRSFCMSCVIFTPRDSRIRTV